MPPLLVPDLPVRMPDAAWTRSSSRPVAGSRMDAQITGRSLGRREPQSSLIRTRARRSLGRTSRPSQASATGRRTRACSESSESLGLPHDIAVPGLDLAWRNHWVELQLRVPEADIDEALVLSRPGIRDTALPLASCYVATKRIGTFLASCHAQAR
jgi:hypothetical protein